MFSGCEIDRRPRDASRAPTFVSGQLFLVDHGNLFLTRTDDRRESKLGAAGCSIQFLRLGRWEPFRSLCAKGLPATRHNLLKARPT